MPSPPPLYRRHSGKWLNQGRIRADSGLELTLLGPRALGHFSLLTTVVNCSPDWAALSWRLSVGWRDLRQDVSLDLLDGLLWANGRDRWVPLDPGVNRLGPKVREDGNHPRQQLPPRHPRPSCASWYRILVFVIFSEAVLLSGTWGFAGTLALLVWNHPEHHKDREWENGSAVSACRWRVPL